MQSVSCKYQSIPGAQDISVLKTNCSSLFYTSKGSKIIINDD